MSMRSQKDFLDRVELPEFLKQEIEKDLWPNAELYTSYALTEASPAVTVLKPSDKPREWGSVGRPYMCTEVRIVDEDDHDLPVGKEGEIIVRGPTVFKGYYKNPEETARTLRGGWLHTGDVGKYDDLGYLYMVDRIKDMIKEKMKEIAGKRWNIQISAVRAELEDIMDEVYIDPRIQAMFPFLPLLVKAILSDEPSLLQDSDIQAKIMEYMQESMDQSWLREVVEEGKSYYKNSIAVSPILKIQLISRIMEDVLDKNEELREEVRKILLGGGDENI